MKIAFNTSMFQLQNPGGGEMVIRQVQKALQEQGVDAQFFNPWEMELKTFDLVHEFHLGQWRDWPSYEKFGMPFVVTPTTWPPDDGMEIKKAAARNFVSRALGREHLAAALRLPRKIFPTTNLEKSRLIDYYGLADIADRVTAVPNGVVTPPDALDTQRFCEQLGQVTFALFVGRVTPIKNVDLIIRGCAEVGIPLIIAGKPDVMHPDYYKKCERLAEGKQVTFIGELPHGSQNFWEAYSAAQVVCLPSDFETFGMVGIEAGIVGTPVVITGSGGTKEVYEDCVSYCEPGSLSSFTSALRTALQKNGEDDTLREHVRSRYSWARVASQLRNLYEDALS